jgi:hypothetical protein
VVCGPTDMRNFWVLFANNDDDVDASREFMSVYLM